MFQKKNTSDTVNRFRSLGYRFWVFQKDTITKHNVIWSDSFFVRSLLMRMKRGKMCNLKSFHGIWNPFENAAPGSAFHEKKSRWLIILWGGYWVNIRIENFPAYFSEYWCLEHQFGFKGNVFRQFVWSNISYFWHMGMLLVLIFWYCPQKSIDANII